MGSLEKILEITKAIAEVGKSTSRKCPFEKSLHSVKEGQMARKNSDRTLFQKKENPLQKQPNFTSSYDKHGGINLFNSKQIIF